MVKPETAASWLQKMVRAEAALASTADVMLSGQYTRLEVPVGQCACVTCGIVLPWSSPSYKGRQMQGGHWIPKSQGREMLMLLEDNVWPQCSLCNLPETRAGGWGNREIFNGFILHHLGFARFQIIERLKTATLTADEINELSDNYRVRYRKAKQELERYG